MDEYLGYLNKYSLMLLLSLRVVTVEFKVIECSAIIDSFPPGVQPL